MLPRVGDMNLRTFFFSILTRSNASWVPDSILWFWMVFFLLLDQALLVLSFDSRQKPFPLVPLKGAWNINVPRGTYPQYSLRFEV
jgi:hypothetical protein